MFFPHKFKIILALACLIAANWLFASPAGAADLAVQLAGRILIAVESRGEAWYVSPDSRMRYFLGRPADAFAVMREQGRGITNVDLKRIPIAWLSIGADADRDGLGDGLEAALGTNLNLSDTDRDGFSDSDEIKNGYDPLGAGKLPINPAFSRTQAGRIFLAVEKNGEAWYVNPADFKRYFLGRPADAFAVMQKLGLGVKNADLEKIIARTPNYDLLGLATAIQERVNAERKKAGLSELAWNSDLAKVAGEHSDGLALENRYFTNLDKACDFPLIHHEGFSFGFYNKDRLKSRRINYFQRTGENIALVSGADIRVYYRDYTFGEKEINDCQNRRNDLEKSFAARLAAAQNDLEKKSTIEGEVAMRKNLIAAEPAISIAEINWLGTDLIVDKMVSGWLMSPGHRENIMQAEYNEAGLGVAYANGYIIATQIFIKRAACGFLGGPCCDEEGYYPYCFESLKCESNMCR